MTELIHKMQKNKKSYVQVTGVILLLLLAAFLVWFNNSHSLQAIPALVAQVYFDGEYRIGDGEWQKIVEGEHISSTQGDVTLRGNFYTLDPEGGYVGIYRGDLPIALYTDHINLTFYEVGFEPFVVDMENALYGDSVCGEGWSAYFLTSESQEQVEILIHNPHKFGNETAIDQMLSSVALWTGLEFEKSALNEGETQRNAGMMLMLVSFVFLGIALFSSLIHIKSNKLIWLLGLVVLFAGFYFSYSSYSVSLWSESIISNTTMLGLSMMLYMLFLSMSILCFLKGMKKLCQITVVLLAVSDAAFLILPIVTDICFYDTWLWWVIVQGVANILLLICLVNEVITSKQRGQKKREARFFKLLSVWW